MTRALSSLSLPRRRPIRRHLRALLLAALAGLGIFATAGVADAHPRHHKKHGRGAHHVDACAPHYVGVPHGGVYVRPAPVYAYPGVYHPVPVGYRRVWRPGHYYWHAARHCNVWQPGVYVHIRI